MKEQSVKLMAQMANRLSMNRDFMANTLKRYQQLQALDDEELARELATSLAMLVRLALCKRPDTTAQTFDEQMQHLSVYTGIDALLLSRVIRQAESPSLQPAVARH